MSAIVFTLAPVHICTCVGVHACASEAVLSRSSAARAGGGREGEGGESDYPDEPTETAASEVWADTAYRSAANLALLTRRGLKPQFRRKKPVILFPIGPGT